MIARNPIPSFLLLLALPGAASTLYGNPNVKLVLDSGGPVYIGAARAYACPGYETDAVNDTLTTTTSLTASFSEGTWCDLVVQVKWSPGESYDNVPVDGFTTFVTDADEPQRTIHLDPVTRTATLQ